MIEVDWGADLFWEGLRGGVAVGGGGWEEGDARLGRAASGYCN